MTVVTDFGKKNINPLASPFDAASPFAPDLMAVDTPQESKRLTAPTLDTTPKLATAPKIENQGEALQNLGSFFNQQQSQSRALTDMAVESGDFSSIKGADVNKLRQDPKNVQQVFEKEVDEHLVDYVKQNKLPSFIEDEEGNKLYLNTGTPSSINTVSGENFGSEGRWEASGPVGTYTAKWVPTVSPLNNPIVSLAAGMIPGGTLGLQLMRVASGEKLTPVDILGAGLDGLTATGMLKPPQGAAGAKSAGETARRTAMDSGAAFGDAISAGKAAETAALAGKGLGGLSYGQTTGLMRAAAAGDPKQAVISYFGPQIVGGALDKVGITPAVLESKGIPANDFQAGVNKAINKVAQGASAKEALLSGFAEYIKEGGSLGSFSLPDFEGVDIDFPDFGIDFGKLEDAVRAAGSKIEDGARVVGSFVDDATWEQVKDIDLKGIEDGIRTIGSSFDDVVTRPTGEVLSAVDTAAREILPKVEDTVRDIVNPLDNWVDDLPSIDLPSIDLTMPGLMTTAAGAVPVSSTRTTDSLFSDELFKFKTKIEDTQELVPFSTLEFGDVETMPYVYEDLESPLSDFTYDNGLNINIPQQLTQEELLQELFQKQGVSL